LCPDCFGDGFVEIPDPDAIYEWKAVSEALREGIMFTCFDQGWTLVGGALRRIKNGDVQ
jgi:hypothetical protein